MTLETSRYGGETQSQRNTQFVFAIIVSWIVYLYCCVPLLLCTESFLRPYVVHGSSITDSDRVKEQRGRLYSRTVGVSDGEVGGSGSSSVEVYFRPPRTPVYVD